MYELRKKNEPPSGYANHPRHDRNIRALYAWNMQHLKYRGGENKRKEQKKYIYQ
jgi:hypothetical protein